MIANIVVGGSSLGGVSFFFSKVEIFKNSSARSGIRTAYQELPAQEKFLTIIKKKKKTVNFRRDNNLFKLQEKKN